MEGVTSVEQLSDTELRWDEIGGVHRTWDATIVRQEPDQVVAWAATDGARTQAPSRSSPWVRTARRWSCGWTSEPNGVVESVGDLLGVVGRRAEGDLERFREFIEERANLTGGRGTVHGGHVDRETRAGSAAAPPAPTGGAGGGPAPPVPFEVVAPVVASPATAGAAVGSHALGHDGGAEAHDPAAEGDRAQREPGPPQTSHDVRQPVHPEEDTVATAAAAGGRRR